MRIDFEPAYVLSARPYRETSLLLEVLTEHHGRMGVVARGVRGPKARQRGVLRPFAPLLLSWFGNGDLVTMSAVETAALPAALAGERIFFGWYLNELLLKLLQRHDPHPALYGAYARTLGELAGDGAEAAIRVFEKRLLAELGYALPLTDAIDPARFYRIDGDSGLQPADADDLRAVSGSSLRALREERLEGREALRDARRLLRVALARQLAGRELETPKLLRALRRGSALGPGSEAGENEAAPVPATEAPAGPVH